MNCSQLLLLASIFLLVECSKRDKRAPVVNGKRVKNANEFKYQVAIISKQDDWKQICGGGILNDKFILTAAHCFTDEKRDHHGRIIGYKFVTHSAKIRAHTTTSKHTMFGTEIPAMRVFVPASYLKDGRDDIAVLMLTKSLNLEKNTDKLQPMKLPEKNKKSKQFNDYHNERAILAGYGADEVNIVKGQLVKSASRNLNKINVKVTSAEHCRIRTRSKDDRYLCGWPIGKNPGKPAGFCDGDSGEPLVLANGEVIGVAVENSEPCDDRNSSGVYARVSHYLDFIDVTKDEKNHASLPLSIVFHDFGHVKSKLK